jgi:endoglucanase
MTVLLAAAAAGCITSSPSNYGATGAARSTKLGRCPEGLVDDLEDGDSQIVKKEGREGYWFTFVDPAGSTIAPKDNFTPSPGGANGSRFSARMKGKLAASGKSLYAGMGFAFLSPKGKYDASRYKGISFWAKGPGTIRLKTPDVNTAPEGDKCTDCYNDFGVDLFLSDAWTRYSVPFDRLSQQPGWGDRAPVVSKNALFTVQWQVSTPGADYDVWIDDVELVGCP